MALAQDIEDACLDLSSRHLPFGIPAPPGLERMGKQEVRRVGKSDALMLASRSTTADSCLHRLLDSDSSDQNLAALTLEDTVRYLKQRLQQMQPGLSRTRGFAAQTSKPPKKFCGMCGARRNQHDRFFPQCGDAC